MTDLIGVPADYSAIVRSATNSLFKAFENFSEGTLIVDADARIVWISERYAARFGFTDTRQAIGLDCETVIPNSLMREVVQTGKPILLDVLENGREPLVVTRLPLEDESGKTVGAIGFALFDEMKSLTPLFSHYSRVQEELIAARQSLAQARRAKYTLASFVGTSTASLEVKRQARRAAHVDSPVLLLGETGTGKELLAHSIHGTSARASGPLVTVNVAAIPDTLLEVEFFGAAPGAYTGVERRGRVGKFELAHGGTLFLDEIGDMPLPLQGKLLRILQDQEFEPLGSNRIVRTDVRIVAATSADLPALVSAGRFRADLYYRLNVLTIHAPPLRARRSDIEALAYAILEDLSAPGRGGHGRHFELQDDALRLLTIGPATCASCAIRSNVRSCSPIPSGSTLVSSRHLLAARRCRGRVSPARRLSRNRDRRLKRAAPIPMRRRWPISSVAFSSMRCVQRAVAWPKRRRGSAWDARRFIKRLPPWESIFERSKCKDAWRSWCGRDAVAYSAIRKKNVRPKEFVQ